MKSRLFTHYFVLIVLAAIHATAQAEVQFASTFADHMVLQRDAPVPIWGTADAGEAITVEFGGQTKNATANAAGKWIVKLDPLTSRQRAAGPYGERPEHGDCFRCAGRRGMARIRPIEYGLQPLRRAQRSD